MALFAVSVLIVPGGSLSAQGSTPTGQETQAAPTPGCAGFPTQAQVRNALRASISLLNGGLGNDMWATLVNRDGVVCRVVFSGVDRGTQWPGSRIISAQKAYTANAFSLPPGAGGLFPGLSLSSANLYFPVLQGGSLFGLQFSNPVDPRAYNGDATLWGQPNDPLVGRRVGGVNVFGGGLALYNPTTIVGGIGVSGDTSCADHIVSWKTRDALGLDQVPNGLVPPLAGGDNIIHDILPASFNQARPADVPIASASGFGHPQCDAVSTAVAALLPVTDPLG
ncbi:MAG: heme-binding protein [Acidimicrobiales bacterium]